MSLPDVDEKTFSQNSDTNFAAKKNRELELYEMAYGRQTPPWRPEDRGL